MAAHPMRWKICWRPHTELLKPGRSGQERAFDDLYRQFFVAYSRPQEVLLLVGLNAALPEGSVSNVCHRLGSDGQF